jgi:hypothetical protein
MQQSLPAGLPIAAEHAAHDAAPHDAVHRHGTPLFDRLGAVLGFACAIHCIAVPLFLAVLPAVGLGFIADHAFDLTIVIIASLFAALAARSGWRSHGDTRVMAGFSLAVGLLVLGHALGEEGLAGRLPSIIGGLTLAVTHLANLRLSKRSCARAHA